MTVAASILLAALVGGLVFVLIDSWQRRADATATPEPELNWQPPAPVWTQPEARTEPLPPRPRWDADDRDDRDPPPGLWSGWGR